MVLNRLSIIQLYHLKEDTNLQVVQEALSAGKHVIEEKPISRTVAEGVMAIKQYRYLQSQEGPSPLWM
jgi:hypothetical protein